MSNRDFKKITESVDIHQSLPDNPSLPPILLKKEWDKPANIIKGVFNALIDDLNDSTDNGIIVRN